MRSSIVEDIILLCTRQKRMSISVSVFEVSVRYSSFVPQHKDLRCEGSVQWILCEPAWSNTANKRWALNPFLAIILVPRLFRGGRKSNSQISQTNIWLCRFRCTLNDSVCRIKVSCTNLINIPKNHAVFTYVQCTNHRTLVRKLSISVCYTWVKQRWHTRLPFCRSLIWPRYTF